MKRISNYKKMMAVTAAALAMIIALGLEDAMAYFTTYTEAAGSHTVSLGATSTEIDETVSEKTKHVTVRNTSDSYECFVRVKVFSGKDVTCTPSGTNWTYQDDGYWYYGPVVAPGGVTEVLDVSIQLDSSKEEEITEFNVVVIQECTPVIYDEDGNPSADWNAVYTGN